MANDNINLPVRSVAETGRFELVLSLDASRSMHEKRGSIKFGPQTTTRGRF